jgi:peptidoglycan LD-endopeptidase LytH
MGAARVRLLILFAVTVFALTSFFLLRARREAKEQPGSATQAERAGSSVLENPSPLPELSPFTSASPSPPDSPAPSQSPTVSISEGTPSAEPNQSARDATFAGTFVGTLKLIIPVVGVRPDQLQDTFSDARSEGRVHDAIDIAAAAGTPVVAAADGEIVKLFQSERGGTTIYQLSPDKKLIYYYAHLQRYADGLTEGKFVRQGEVIAYVGDTGNAGAGNYHLHFSISVIADPKRYWEGTNINPYPLLRK